MDPSPPLTRASDRYFINKDDLRDLGKRTARGGAISVGAQGARFVLQMLSMVVLARLLTPDDFGLVGMVTVLLQLVMFFRDFGLTQATVQRPEINRQQISNLFWFNVAVSTIIAAVFAVGAPLIADFYSQEKLTTIVWVISFGVLVEGIGLQHSALMMRALQFPRLAAAEVGSQAIAVAVAIYMGWAGYGYWALVALNVCGSLFRTLFYCLATGWLPQRPRRRVGTKPFISYGSNLFGFNILNYFSRNADNILIGKFVSADALGYYSNAYRLLMLPLQQVNGPMTQVVMPMLSRLQHDPERFSTYFYQCLSVVLFITFAAVGLLLAVTDPLILTILGQEWAPCIPIFQLLLPAAYVSAMNVSTGWVFVSLGTTNRQLRWTLFAAPFTVVCMVAGLPYGAIGVAAGVSFALATIRVPYMLYAYKGTPIRFARVCRIIACPLGLSMAAAAGAWSFLYYAGSDMAPVIRLASGSLLYAVLYILLDILIFRSSAMSIQCIRFISKRQLPAKP